IRQAIDYDAPRVHLFDQVEQLIDPFVDVHVHRRACHEVNALVVQRPAETLDDARELGSIFLERGDHARLSALGALKNEVKADERLSKHVTVASGDAWEALLV